MASKDTFFSRKLSINCRGELFDLSIPKVMGILNITPDSFYDGGKYTSESAYLKRVEEMVSEGVDIIDIGGCSYRPGAEDVSEKEELARLLPVLKEIRKQFSELPISINTYRSSIAKKTVSEYGIEIINDISAGDLDHKMFETIAELNVPYIIMHMKGTPKNMQDNPQYTDVVKETIVYFAKKVEKLKLLGVKDVIIDPGFGFGKTLDHNYELMNQLDLFKMFQLPLLIGVSRKTMIYKLLNITPNESLNATTVLNTIALLKGANILRVHDIKQAVETIKIILKLAENKSDKI